MTILASQALSSLQHSLGRAPSSQLSPTGLLNEAGRYLVSMQKWRWLERTYVQLNELAPISITAATFTHATRTLTEVAGFADYTFRGGDRIEITGGTGATLGEYEIESRTDDDAIVLKVSLGAAADAQTDIAGTISFPYVQLPADFRELVALLPTDGLLDTLQVTTMAEIAALRFGSVPMSSFHRRVAITYQSAGLAGGPPTPRLELYPTPTAASFGVLSLAYRAGWQAVSSDQDPLSIPDFIETLYLQLARAFARGYEEEDEGSLDDRLATIRMGPVFAAAVMDDSQMEADLGQIQNGAVGNRWHHSIFGHEFIARSIPGPS